MDVVSTSVFPLSGKVLVTQSPNHPVPGGHGDPSVPQQHYAYDLVPLNDDFAAQTGSGQRLTDIAGYGTPIRSPFGGTVVDAVDGWKELQIGQSAANDADAQQNPAGNHVVIRLDDGNFAYLAHMKTGSVHTELIGSRITPGTELGLMGNSGNTSGPHLHIHVQDELGLYNPAARGVPLRFGDLRRVATFELVDGQGFVNGKPDAADITTPQLLGLGDVVEQRPREAVRN